MQSSVRGIDQGDDEAVRTGLTGRCDEHGLQELGSNYHEPQQATSYNYDGEYDWLHSRCIYITVNYCTVTLIAALANMWPRKFLFWYLNPFMEGGWGGRCDKIP